MRVGGGALLLVLISSIRVAADAPGSPPASPSISTARSPQLARRRGRTAVASAPSISDDGALTDAVPESDAEAAQPEGIASGLGDILQQLPTLFALLAFRVLLHFLLRKGPDGARAPIEGLNEALLSSPIGGVVASIHSTASKIAEFARSPQAGPVMIGLLIVATKLLKRSEAAAEAAQAEAAATEEAGEDVDDDTFEGRAVGESVDSDADVDEDEDAYEESDEMIAGDEEEASEQVDTDDEADS